MNCLDRARAGVASAALGERVDCGAGICAEHLHEQPQVLIRTEALNRQVPVDPATRVLRCGTCDAATTAHYRHATRSKVRT